jgi:hypothetical protein
MEGSQAADIRYGLNEAYNDICFLKSVAKLFDVVMLARRL